MPSADPSSLVGTTVLTDLRVDALVRVDGALATYAATSSPDGMECSLRVALSVALPAERDGLVSSSFQRLSRHAVGVRGLCAPRSAGAVVLGSDRLLAMAHLGSPRDSAEDRLAGGLAMPVEELVLRLQPVSAALAALHDQGLVHGAVHPGAVRLGALGPVLSAFGLSELALLIGGPAAARDIVPPRSRVPEQVGIVAASPVPESDSYAFAMILCELLAGRPFTSETDASSIARAIDSPLVRPTPSTLSVAVPEHVDQAFSRALQTQPRERAMSPSALLTALTSPAPPKPEEREPGAVPQPQLEPPARSRRFRSALERVATQGPAKEARREEAETTARPRLPASDASAWLMYLLVLLGVLLLFGGAATVFVLALRRPHPASPAASAPALAIPVPAPPPPVTPGGPAESSEPEPEPEPASSAPPALSSAPSAHPPLAGPALWPEDLTALVPIAKDTPVLGSRDALVTIVLFADMQCPHTRKARLVLDDMRRTYGDDLRIAVRHLPIPAHDKAELLAEASATAGALAGPHVFWKLFDQFTASQSTLTEDQALHTIEQSGAPIAAVRRSMEEHVFRRIVEADREVAQRLMVRATPTFFVNGKRLEGELPRNALAEEIDKEVAASRAALARGIVRPRLYSTRVVFNVTSAEADPERRPAPRVRPRP